MTTTDTRADILANAARSIRLVAAVRRNVHIAWGDAYEKRIRPWRLIVRSFGRRRGIEALAVPKALIEDDASLAEGQVPLLLLAAALDEAQALRCDGCEDVAEPPYTGDGAGCGMVLCPGCAARVHREAPEMAAMVRLLTDEERAVCMRGVA